MHNLFYLVCCAISLSTCHTTVQCCAINTLPTGTAAVADCCIPPGGTSDAALCWLAGSRHSSSTRKTITSTLTVCARVCCLKLLCLCASVNSCNDHFSLQTVWCAVPSEMNTIVFVFCRSCQSMTSLFSNTVSPAKDGCSSLPRRPSNLNKPPLRALYDLLIAPMEGVSI